MSKNEGYRPGSGREILFYLLIAIVLTFAALFVLAVIVSLFPTLA